MWLVAMQSSVLEPMSKLERVHRSVAKTRACTSKGGAAAIRRRLDGTPAGTSGHDASRDQALPLGSTRSLKVYVLIMKKLLIHYT
jgi:hypothetical protein